MFPVITATAFFALVLAAAVSDIRTRKVTNRLNMTILLLGLGWRAASLDGGTLVTGVAGVGVGLAVLFPPFAARWMGAGDVKLLAACGMWLGPWGAVLAGLFGIAGGGMLSVAIAMSGGAEVRRSVYQNMSASITTLTAPIAPARAKALVVPLAVPLAASVIAVFLARGF